MTPLQRSVLQHFLVMVYPAVRRVPVSVRLQRAVAMQPRVSSLIKLLTLKAEGGQEDQQSFVKCFYIEHLKMTYTFQSVSVCGPMCSGGKSTLIFYLNINTAFTDSG